MDRIRKLRARNNIRGNSSANKALLQKYSGDQVITNELAHLVLAIRVLRGHSAA